MAWPTDVTLEPEFRVTVEPKSQTDPYSQIGILQQCLSSNKRPLGIFLGAGCPMGIRNGSDPLIPDIAGLTARVRSDLEANGDLRPHLEKVMAQFATDGKPDPTVEHLLSHIRSLKSVAGKGDVRGLTSENLTDLDKGICEVVQVVVNKALPGRETPYHRLASWVESIERDLPLEVFTTNYDLLMEQAFEEVGIPFFDGFAGSRKPFFDLQSVESAALPSRWARLWKLHGSINWYQKEGRGVYRGSSEEKGERRVIHPSHLKYEESRRMPYLAMIDRLRAFLKQPANNMFLCGYSFRDEHLNEVIVQGLQSTPSAAAFALLYGGISAYPEAVQLAKRRSNLILLAKDGGVISGTEMEWIRKTEESLTGLTGNPWIGWESVAGGEGDGIKKAVFNLGDFAVFGKFLFDMIGPITHSRGLFNGS